MTPAHKRFLTEQFFGGIVVNFVLNAAIGWVIFRTAESAPFLGLTSVLGDTLVMGFLLPFFVCLFVTLDTRKKMKSGRFSVVPLADAVHPVIERMPLHLVKRSAVLGVIGLGVVVPLLLVMYFGLGLVEMGRWDFVWFKGTLAALMSAPISLLVVMRGFSDEAV